MSQSTNDVYPTAVNLALNFAIEPLLASMRYLRAAFEAKAAEFADVLKVGRTQLQDAVPMTLGQEFSAFAVMLAEDEARLRGGGPADARDQPRRHRHRHGHQRPPGLRRAGRAASSATSPAMAARHRAQPGRGDPGRRRVRAALRSAQAHRRKAVEDLQRPAPAVLGPARRVQRDQPAGRSRPGPASCRARSTR